jgi:hypothetical protein
MLTLQENTLLNQSNGVRKPVDYIFSYRLEYRHGDNGAIINQETVALARKCEYCPPGFILTVDRHALPLSELFKSRWWNEAEHTYFYPNDLSVKVGGICLPEDKEIFIDYIKNAFRVAMMARLEKSREVERGILTTLSLTLKTKKSKVHNHH